MSSLVLVILLAVIWTISGMGILKNTKVPPTSIAYLVIAGPLAIVGFLAWKLWYSPKLVK